MSGFYSSDEFNNCFRVLNNEMKFKKPTLKMVVVLVKFNKNFIDLALLARKTHFAHFLKSRFAAAILRYPPTGAAGLIFSSGNMVITFNNIDLRSTLEEFFVKKIRIVDPFIQIVSSKIVNTTICCGISDDYRGIFLNRIQGQTKKSFELFPGLSKNLQDEEELEFSQKKNKKVSNPKLIVFGSGKFNLTGCVTLTQIETCYREAITIIEDKIKF